MPITAALEDKKDVGELVLRRLSAAGLDTVGKLREARPEEIAASAGLHLSIVNKVLGHLSADLRCEHVEHPSDGNVPRERALPAAVEALHEQILCKLRVESESESSREKLRAEIHELRSRILEHRTELRSLDACLNRRKKDLEIFSRRISDKADLVDEYRARRVALERRYVSSSESIRHMEKRLRHLRRKRRHMEEKLVTLSRAMVTLVGEVERIRRSVARRRLQS